jgi:hypothetical protein
MSLYLQISREVLDFTQYATANNPSKPIGTWIDEHQKIRCHLIYQRCISCNEERFTDDQLKTPPRGYNTYCCGPCFRKISKQFIKYQKNEEEKKVFKTVWNTLIFP